jgi:hypothetical protein
MTVEFRLLGDVEARLDGRRIDMGHARQRCVLVALLVDVNRPVPADHLIDRVWADRPPYRARNALSAYLSRLRHLMAGADDVRIAREPGGYVLSADPLAVDLHRFRHLVAQARAADRPGAVAALFDEALELWRGEAFTSLDTPWFADLRTSLEAERLAVTLDRNDVALLAGRHSELLGELSAAVRSHPLDERFAGDQPAIRGAAPGPARCRSRRSGPALRARRGGQILTARRGPARPARPRSRRAAVRCRSTARLGSLRRRRGPARQGEPGASCGVNNSDQRISRSPKLCRYLPAHSPALRTIRTRRTR